MGRRTILALGLIFAAMSGGCGTVHNLKLPTYPPPSNPDAPVCCIYGGVRGDGSAIVRLPWRHMPSYIDYGIIPVMCAIDMGFTAVGDTVTLPYTVGSELARMFIPPPPKKPLPPKPGSNSKLAPKPVPIPVPVPDPEPEEPAPTPRGRVVQPEPEP